MDNVTGARKHGDERPMHQERGVRGRSRGDRFNSVILRSSGQDLTTWGTYIEMISRLLEPALLALAVLAVRGRIKR